MKFSIRSFTKYFIILLVFITNLSQLPFLIGNGLFKIVNYSFWLLSLIILIINKKNILIKNKYKIYFFYIFILLISVFFVIFGKNGNTNIIFPLSISMFVLFIGYNFGNIYKMEDFKLIAYSFIISGLIVAMSVFLQMISNGFSWTSRVYAYASKNSVSQILVTVFILLAVFQQKQNKIFKLIFNFIFGLLLIELCMLKSRASLLCIVFILIYLISSKKVVKSTKTFFLIMFLVFIVLIMFYPNFKQFIIDNIIFAGRDSNSLSSISSGRTEMLESFFQLFKEYPFFGHGNFYFENMQLGALLEYGLIGGLVINIIAILPIIYAIKNYRLNSSINNQTLMLLAISYYVNGFFEQLSPFGPGVKCYFLWFLYGLSLYWNKRS